MTVPADFISNSEPPIQSSDLGDEHEATDGESAERATDTSESDTSADPNSVVEDDGNIADTRSESTTNAQHTTQVGEVVASAAPGTKNLASPAKSKPGLAVKPPQGKMPSAPPTPIVKKIISSGTFGTGTVKTAPRNSVASSSNMKPATAPAPPLKKSSSTPTAPTAAKPSVSAPRTSVSITASSRRASVVPTKPAASAGTKASVPPGASKPTSATPSSVAPRPSVVSPTGSTTSLKSSAAVHRSRPSISEGAKRSAPTGAKPTSTAATRPSAGATKPSAARSSSTVAAATKPSKPSASVSSIHEVKENGNDDEVKEANEELALKEQSVNDLKNQVKQLEASLADAQAEIAAKVSSIDDLERVKAIIEAGYQHRLEASSKQRDELTAAITTQLETAKEQVLILQSAVQAKEEEISALSSQKSTLGVELSEVTEKLEAFHRSNETSVQEEHQALLKAEADLKAAAAEIDALKLAHTQVGEALKSRTQDLEECTSQIRELEARITEMKTGREEYANKVSELEVEILELKESQESLEDERDKLQANVKELEEQISSLSAAAQQAEEASHAKGVEVAAKITDLEAQHAKDIQLAADERAKIAAELTTLEAQLGRAQHDLEIVKKDADAATEAHSQKLEEMEGAFALQKSELQQEIRKINAELEGQEAKYHSRLEAVKAEHEALLQDAFNRAKIEAGEKHASELQRLRESSEVTIEQLQAATKANVENMRADYNAARESDVKELEKHISTLNLDLRAAKDDLSKAKAALEAASLDLQSLTKQRDDALAASAATPSVSTEHLEEIARLTNELSQSKDDLAAMTDMLNLTKASLSELSNNHTKELEEGAKARAEEVTKIRTAHDAETVMFATQKSELSLRISDLEGELATLKASIAAEQPVSKSNRVTQSHSPDSTGVTKEELQRMHEAHNLKIYDLEAEHVKAMQTLREELRVAQQKADELRQEVARKAMEIQYLEQDQEDDHEQIARLKEDLRSAQQLNGGQTSST